MAAGVRTLDEVKAEVRRRAGKVGPFESIAPREAEGVIAGLCDLDPDTWAAAWSARGLALEEEADAAAAGGAAGKELAERYLLAFDFCRVGRYPSPTSPGKRKSYEHSLRIFRKAAAHLQPRLEIVELPFADGKLVGYLQIPHGAERPPVVLHWGGVDGWKEDRLRVSAALHKLGLATLAIDMPGSGECPVRYLDPRAEASYVAWLDHLAARDDVDGRRVGVWGGSFGGYWAARLAHTQAERIRAAVFHGGNVHYGFQRAWLEPAFTTGGATYLFGAASLLDARGAAMGTTTLEGFLAAAPALSLLDMGLLDQPCAPLLAINGKLDDQAPIADVYLLLEHGSPKSARVYADGHHMGRSASRRDAEIAATIATWLAGQLG